MDENNHPAPSAQPQFVTKVDYSTVSIVRLCTRQGWEVYKTIAGYWYERLKKPISKSEKR